MKTKSPKQLSLIVIAAFAMLGLFASTAGAQAGNYQAEVPPSTTDWQTGDSLLSDMDVLQFDPAKGELVAVEVKASGEISSLVNTLINVSSRTENFTAFSNVDYCFDITSRYLGSHSDCEASASSSKIAFSAVAEQLFPGVPASATVSGSLPVSGAASDSLTLTGADVEPFKGTGFVYFRASTLTAFGARGGGGNADVSIRTTAGARVEVSYACAKINVEVATNGQDADTDPVQLRVGEPVNYTYVVTNECDALTNVVITTSTGEEVCTIGDLAAGESQTCERPAGTANEGETCIQAVATGVNAAYPTTNAVSDTDPTCYTSAVPTPTPLPATPTPIPPTSVPTAPTPAPSTSTPSIDIELSTNGHDADVADGPSVASGSAINWVYAVTNNGNEALSNVVVTDGYGAQVCVIGSLAVGESTSCTQTGIASCSTVSGAQRADSTVQGTSPQGVVVTDSDPTHWSVQGCGNPGPGTVVTPPNPTENPFTPPQVTAVPTVAPAPTTAPTTEPTTISLDDEDGVLSKTTLAHTGTSGNIAAGVAMVFGGVGLVCVSAAEALRRRNQDN